MTMKKNKIILFVTALYASLAYSQSNYYVSPSGHNTNLGTESAPFKTIEKALNSFDGTGGTCYISEGTYHEEISLDGKTNITMRPYNNDTVIIDGTESIPSSGWTTTDGTIYETTITSGNNIWQLFIDDKQQVMARWPNAQFSDKTIYDHKKWAKGTDSGTTNTHIEVDTSNGKPNLANLGVSVQGAMVIANVGNWKTWARTVTSHLAGQNEFDYTTAGSFTDVHNYFYLECKKELIDTNNEWFYDKITKKLYVYGNPAGKTIKGKTQSYAFSFLNASNITIKGLLFFGTTVQFNRSNNVSLQDCNFAYASCSKRMLQNEGTPNTTELMATNLDAIGNHSVVRCLFEYIDGEAIYLQGKDNTVENCYFQYIDYSCASIRFNQNTIVCNGANFKVTQSTMHTVGASETIRGRKKGLEMSYNNVYNTGLVQSDGAVFGAGQGNGVGSRIHHNWVHDSRKGGIRFDAPVGSSALGGKHGVVDHNVVWNCGSGIKMKGDINQIYNNTAFNNNSIDISVLNEQMPSPSTIYSNVTTVTKNNLARQISGNRNNPENLGGDNVIPGIHSNNVHSQTATPYDVIAQLEDAYNYNFMPKSSAVALINQGVTDITSSTDPLTGITSPLTDGSIGLPDVGAYELGGENWTAGIKGWIPKFYPWNVADNITATISDAQVTEGSELAFNLSLNKISGTETTVTLGFQNITAATSDYESTNFQLTIPANITHRNFTIATTDDLDTESNETFIVKILSIDSGTLHNFTDTGIGTIVDNDIQSPSDRNGFVLNPSFELTPNFDKWTYTGNNGAISISNDVAVTNSGTNSAIVQVNTPGSQGSVKLVGTPYSFAGNNIDNINVTVTLRMKVETVTSGKRVKMLLRNAASGSQSSRSKQFSGLTTEWQEFTYTTNFSPASNYQLYLDLNFGEYPGKIYIDHITSTVGGATNLSGSTSSLSVTEHKLNTIAVNAYPNPTNSAVTFISTGAVIKNIDLYNSLGSKIMSHKKIDNSEVSLQLEHLANGIYFARILFQDNSINTLRILKN